MPSVRITTGGRLENGHVYGGDRLAARSFDLEDGPMSMGRDSVCTIRIPQAGTEISGRAAIISRNEFGICLRLTNRPGGTVCTADNQHWVFPREEDPVKVNRRRAWQLHDGDMLWLPPRQTAADALIEGYWILFDLDGLGAPLASSFLDEGGPSGDTDLDPVKVNSFRTLTLSGPHKLLLNAIFADYVSPDPDKPYQRAPAPGELLAMLAEVGETSVPPTLKALHGRLETLIGSVLSQTKTLLPEEAGHHRIQLLADWCQIYMDKSWFDHRLAERLIDIRRRHMGTNGTGGG